MHISETFQHENQYTKSNILQCLGAVKLIFQPHVVHLGSSRTETRNCFVPYSISVSYDHKTRPTMSPSITEWMKRNTH